MSSLVPEILARFLVKDKTVVITGGARGLGLNFGIGLAQAGAHVAAIDIGDEPSEGFKTLSQYGGKYKYYKADVRDYEGLKVTIDRIAEDFGSIDGCIPAAGIIRDKTFLQHTQGDFEDSIGINVNGVFFTVQHCAAQMVKQGTGGRIVCIASTAGHRSLYPQTIAAYTASKYAVRGIVKQVAAELAPHNIRVNSISPGVIMTDMLQSIITQTPSRQKLFEDSNAMKRIATPDELVGMVLYLMSDASSYTTGQDFLVDGGQI